MKIGSDAIKTGAWTEQQTFTVLSKLDAPGAKLNDNFRTLHLSWADQRAKEYEVQISRTANFESNNTPSDLIIYTVKKPVLDIPDPTAGKHFVRYRALEENGVLSGWSSTMEVDVPKELRSLWFFFWAAITAIL
jgi:hypothetical protein